MHFAFLICASAWTLTLIDKLNFGFDFSSVLSNCVLKVQCNCGNVIKSKCFFRVRVVMRQSGDKPSLDKIENYYEHKNSLKNDNGYKK